MDREYIEIYNETGEPTGKKLLKSEIHSKGIIHSTIHLWIFSDRNKILIQKRSKNKTINPGTWDVSVAGHIKYGEEIVDAVIRESKEETGVTIIKRIAAAQFDPHQRIAFQSKHAIQGGDGPRYSSNAPVYEVQTVPYPDFVNITYTINFWSSYVSHVNKFHEMVWQSAYPTDFEYNGHRFFASINTQSDEGNIENFSDEERIIRHTFDMEVSAYLLDTNPKIKIERTVTKIALQELVIDASEIRTTRDGASLTLGELVETGERIDFYNRGLETDVDDTVYAITTEDGEILITEAEMIIAGDLALTEPSYVGPNDSNNPYG